MTTKHKIPHLRPMSDKPENDSQVLIKLEDGRQANGYYSNRVIGWFAYLDKRLRPLEDVKAAGWCYPEDLELPPPPPPELPKVTTGRELLELTLEYAAARKKLKAKIVHKVPSISPEACTKNTLVDYDKHQGVFYINEGTVAVYAYWLDSDLATVEVLPDEDGEAKTDDQ